MTWKLKKEWRGKRVDALNIALEDLSQKQIKALSESLRNSLFIEEKPTSKKKYDTSD